MPSLKARFPPLQRLTGAANCSSRVVADICGSESWLCGITRCHACAEKHRGALRRGWHGSEAHRTPWSSRSAARAQRKGDAPGLACLVEGASFTLQCSQRPGAPGPH